MNISFWIIRPNSFWLTCLLVFINLLMANRHSLIWLLQTISKCTTLVVKHVEILKKTVVVLYDLGLCQIVSSTPVYLIDYWYLEKDVPWGIETIIGNLLSHAFFGIQNFYMLLNFSEYGLFVLLWVFAMSIAFFLHDHFVSVVQVNLDPRSGCEGVARLSREKG